MSVRVVRARASAPPMASVPTLRSRHHYGGTVMPMRRTGRAAALLACAATATLGLTLPSEAVPDAVTPGRDTAATLVGDGRDGQDAPQAERAEPARGDALIARADDDGPKSRPEVPRAPRLDGAYRFVSAPDFLNQDVADLTADGRETYVDPATGNIANSTNASYERALAHVLDEMASHGTDDMLVAGDLVEGRWGRDDSGAGVFGPARTSRERLVATRRAAAVYYPAWLERVAAHGLTPYPAVGDHEMGDDPWERAGDPWVTHKRAHWAEFKRLYARHVMTMPDGTERFVQRPPRGQARDTAYAVRLDPNVLLVTLDVFTRHAGDVRMQIDKAQLHWLRGVLRRARRADVPWVMVQGHTPIAGPVRVRNSTGLRYRKGTRSALWRTMVKGGVDVYLCGEVHDQTVTVRDGLLQVTHGSLFYRGEASYVLGQATARRLVLENRQFRGRMDFSGRLWTTSQLGAPGGISYPDPSLVTGTLSARRTRDGGIDVEDTAGIFRPLR